MIRKFNVLKDGETLVQLYGLTISLRWDEVDKIILASSADGDLLMSHLICYAIEANVLPDIDIELLQTLILMRCEYLVGVGKLGKKLAERDGMNQVYITRNSGDVDKETLDLFQLCPECMEEAVAKKYPGTWTNDSRDHWQMWSRVTV